MAADRSRRDVARCCRCRRQAGSRPRSTACGVVGHTRLEPTRTSRAGRSSAPNAWATPRTTSSCASDCAKASSAVSGSRAKARGSDSTRLLPTDATDDQMRAYYAARAPEYDDWYLRRGRYSHGVIADAAWNAELDSATQWLDALPIGGEIVELAAGTGWWSPLLASKGTLWLYDANEEPLDQRARPPCRPRPRRPHPCARRVGRAGSPGRRALLRLLAQPRSAHPPGRVPGALRALAQAGRLVRVHRLRGAIPIERQRPSDTRRRLVHASPRRRSRVHDPKGLLRAAPSWRLR